MQASPTLEVIKKHLFEIYRHVMCGWDYLYRREPGTDAHPCVCKHPRVQETRKPDCLPSQSCTHADRRAVFRVPAPFTGDLRPSALSEDQEDRQDLADSGHFSNEMTRFLLAAIGKLE